MKKIELEKTYNTRDFGGSITKDGKKIKDNRIIRSGHLQKLSEKDINSLKEHNLAIVVDFRSKKEFEHRADVKIEGVKYINLPALKQERDTSDEKNKNADNNLLSLVKKDNAGRKFMLQTYYDLIYSNEGIAAYKELFKILSSNKEGAVLFHCSQGKDRAGIAAFLVQYALGMNLEDCLEDYMKTNEAMELKIKQLTPLLMKESNNDYSLIPILEEVFSCRMEYIENAIQSMKDNFGSIEYYIENILEVDIKALRENYLSQ